MRIEDIDNAAEKMLEDSKIRVRKTDDNDLDKDLKRHIAFAIEDLARIGVHEDYLKEINAPILIEAVLTYVNANYRMDSNHERLMNNYNMILTKIKGGDFKSKPQSN
ncbi:hypothetical protein LJC51_08955 [Lachnospiraceae bacterium OttesenSCG-928-J05]|nr:hypothetical protein [Lachnospiraceae bacterium OttesenSCG-928-J05]